MSGGRGRGRSSVSRERGGLVGSRAVQKASPGFGKGFRQRRSDERLFVKSYGEKGVKKRVREGEPGFI